MAKRKSGKGAGKKSGKAKRPTRRTSVKRVSVKAKKPAAAPKPIKRVPLRRRHPGARPAPHKAPPLVANIYERDLDKTPANFAMLTPLQFLERTASVYPDKIALVHGPRCQSWAETYTRCRKLASALEKVGIGKGDTVTIMAPNIPEMYEAHFGVPMCGAVLNTLNTRLDAETIAFMLRHGGARALITDREFSATIEQALRLLDERPLVIDIDDPSYRDGKTLGEIDYEALLAEGDPD